MKIFIGIIVCIFMVSIFWATSWRITSFEIKTKQKDIECLNDRIEDIIRQQREIPLLKSEIMELDQEKQQLKSEIIKDFNDVNKPLVKIQQRLIEHLNKQKEKQQKK